MIELYITRNCDSSASSEASNYLEQVLDNLSKKHKLHTHITASFDTDFNEKELFNLSIFRTKQCDILICILDGNDLPFLTVSELTAARMSGKTILALASPNTTVQDISFLQNVFIDTLFYTEDDLIRYLQKFI